ncbi:hypothetical protein [Propionimicrobium sp. PCR01-08-3]|uniref:hypothetical protein n=1 Tax=Propionimicrobium sp. PCR01-08-3 TaxID=3052086 RepID=UPI00255CD049|nr:hypothetical protein [Propionimicrobium sp. PCR01-08-3]WIY82735.1 hypothetical protein QQ658_14760 [Propionimicrobium sp. PCR01-08-3]
MARTHKKQRPKLSLYPSPLLALGTTAAALVLFAITWLSRDDGWPALVWAIPGVFIFCQPITGWVRGEATQLRVGFRKFDLSKLHRVTIFNRKQLGFSYSVMVLKSNQRVDQVSGAFLTSKSFTKLVDWVGISPEVLQGTWNDRALAATRPDLTQTPLGR